MNHRVILTIVTAVFAMSMNNTASAGSTQSDVNLCRITLETESRGKFDGATFKFGSTRGAALRKLTYQMKFAGESHEVVCKIRKGVVIEIVWPDSPEHDAKRNRILNGPASASS